jgi:trehalose 6-phosphate phosphatase
MGWAYFFDIDGTLVDFAPAPDAVQADPRLRERLTALYEVSGGALALISGRALAEVDRLFLGLQLPAAGQHGLERRTARGEIFRHSVTPGGLADVRARLAERLSGHAGILLEDKGLSLAVHFRQAPERQRFVRDLLASTQADLGDQYCLQYGKYVVELKPAGRDKGVAVLEFMQESPFHGRTPVFIGDDATDEYGFTIVNRFHGHSVKVGPGETVARWRLADVAAVRGWLERGLASLPR